MTTLVDDRPAPRCTFCGIKLLEGSLVEPHGVFCSTFCSDAMLRAKAAGETR
jgi:hypothetical protein